MGYHCVFFYRIYSYGKRKLTAQAFFLYVKNGEHCMLTEAPRYVNPVFSHAFSGVLFF